MHNLIVNLFLSGELHVEREHPLHRQDYMAMSLIESSIRYLEMDRWSELSFQDNQSGIDPAA